MRRWVWLLVLLAVPALHAQVTNPGVRYVTTAPSGACSPFPPIQVVTSTGIPYTCNNGTWGAAGGGGSSLPTASAAGQAPVSTGSGTTYTAQTVALGSQLQALVPTPTVSAAAPLYAEFAFRDNFDSMIALYSNDALHYAPGGGQPLLGLALRDPTALLVAGKFYFYATQNDAANASYFKSFNSSTMLPGSFSSNVNVTVTGSPGTVWRPTAFFDSASTNYYMYVSTVATAGTPTTAQVSTFVPSTNVFAGFSAITFSGETTCTSGQFDYRVYGPIASTYYMFYACQQGGSTQYIHIASSSSPTGTFTRLNAGTNDFFGFGSSSENPDMVLLSNGNIRLFADTWTTNPAGGGRTYTRKYVDTSSAFATVIGTPARVPGPEQEGGTNVTIAAQADAVTLFNGINALADTTNQLYGPLGFDGPPNDVFSIALNNGGLQALQNSNPFAGGTPSIGLQNADGSWSGMYPGANTGVMSFGDLTHTNNGIVSAGQFVANVALQTTSGIPVIFQANNPGTNFSLFASTGAKILQFQDVTDNTYPVLLYGAPYAGFAAQIGLQIPVGGYFQWNNAANGLGTNDTFMGRAAAGSVTLGTSAGGSQGLLTAAGFVHGGTKFSVTGCGTATSLIGGSTAGQFTGGSSTCSPVITTNITAPNGYSCSMQDQTTSTAVFRETANTTTTVTFTGSGTIGATDVINFGCSPF